MTIYPKPLRITEREGSLSVGELTVSGGEFASAAAFFDRIVFRRFGKHAVSRPGGMIRFTHKAGKAGSYTLHADEDGVHIAAADREGAVCAAATLFQMLIRGENGFRIPYAEICDEPYLPIRGVHLYLPARKNIGVFMRILDMMASVKMNTVIIEVGGGMEYERHPEINESWKKFCHQAAEEFPGVDRSYSLQWADRYWKDSVHTELAGASCLTKAEVRMLVEHAKGLGMNVIPEIQALSHSYYMTTAHREIAELQDDPFPDSYCPLNEKSYELYFDLADEVIGVFQPETVSVGHDEVRILGQCERCRGKKGDALFAYELNRLHSFYSARGIRMAMWGEGLQNFRTFRGEHAGGLAIEHTNAFGAYYFKPATYQAIDQIPTDILMLDWYHAQGDTSEDDFSARGIEMIYGNTHGSLFGEWDIRSRKKGVLGAEVSTWCVTDEDTLAFDGSTYEILYTAGILWMQDYGNDKRDSMRQSVLGYMPAAHAVLHGTAFPSDSGTPRLLWKPAASDPASAVLHIGNSILPDTPQARALTVFGEQVPGVPIDTAQLFIRCDIKAESLIFLAAAKEPMPYRQSWRFPEKKNWELGTAAVFYEDGSVEIANHVYGKTLGALHYDFGSHRASGTGAEIDENGSDSGTDRSRTSVSPYFADNMPWLGALSYHTTPVYDGSCAAFAYEWINPHPDKRITAVKEIHSWQVPPQSVILFGIAAIE